MAKNGRILVADDDASLQQNVQRVAALHGYEAISADIGLEVVAIAAQLQPDLIVLEMRFPDADGRDLFQQLKQNPNTTGIPVIAWSREPHESLRLIALALGAEDFVEKGDSEILLPKIARVLLRLDEERSARDSFWPAGNAHAPKW